MARFGIDFGIDFASAARETAAPRPHQQTLGLTVRPRAFGREIQPYVNGKAFGN